MRRDYPFYMPPARITTFASTASLMIALAIPLALLATPLTLAAQEEGLRTGARPDLPVLETLDGEPADLAALADGKPVLIQFWATWCAVCKALEPSVKAAHERYGDRAELIIIAAAVAQTRDQVRRHLQRMPMPGHVVWDVEGRGTRALDAPGTGYVVVLDASGAVVYSGVGVRQDLVAALGAALDEK